MVIPIGTAYGLGLNSPQQGVNDITSPGPLFVTSQVTQPPDKQSKHDDPPVNCNSGVIVAGLNVGASTIANIQRPLLPKKVFPVNPVNKLTSIISISGPVPHLVAK